MTTRKEHMEQIVLHEALAAEYRALAQLEEPLGADCTTWTARPISPSSVRTV
ncbi:MAG: hypothetical protein JO020_25280 [Chloroflexi bacterium]|nr:hypothetical protein [Chloroflexota bacterium]